MMRDLALEFVRLGHQVTVVTPSDSVNGALKITLEGGVTLVQVKTGSLRGANNFLRMWREGRLSSTIWRAAHKFFHANPCDLIVFYSPTIFFGRLVARLKSLWHCPSYLILRDIFPKWAVDTGLLKKGWIYRYLKRKELAQYAASDIIGVEAPGNLGYFSQETQNGEYRVEVLHNWLDAQWPPKTDGHWRSKLGLNNKVIFVFGGNIGKAQDMDNIVRLASGLQHQQEISFLLVGSGAEVQRIVEQINKQNIGNIVVLPSLPQGDYLQCIAECDVGMISLDRRLKSHNVPGKVLGYVQCGLPILASVNPGNNLVDLLHQAGAGIACINGEDDELRCGALQLATRPEVRRLMGRNARGLADTTFSVRVIAGQILSHFGPQAGDEKNMLNQSSRPGTSDVRPTPATAS